MNATIEKIYTKVLGYTENVTICDRCGKHELKGTYAVDTPENGIIYMGSTCVGRRMEYNAKEVRAFISKEMQERKKEMQIEINTATAEIQSLIEAKRSEYETLQKEYYGAVKDWYNNGEKGTKPAEIGSLIKFPGYWELVEKEMEIKREIKGKYNF